MARNFASALALSILAAARAAGAQSAQPAPAATAAPADAIPSHDSLSVPSRHVGETRRVLVHVPRAYAGGGARFPTLYMPDGGLDEDFPHVVNTVDSLIALGRIRPYIVVGIPNTERRRDLTGPTRVKSDSAIAAHVGGAGAFRAFIRDELIPAIDARYRTSGERAIVGESLAGLFILDTFLREPSLFPKSIALDPSVWWNANALVAEAPSLFAGFDAAPRRLFVATSSVADIAEGTRAIVASMPPRAGLRLEYQPRPDLTHGNIFREVGPAALAWLLR